MTPLFSIIIPVYNVAPYLRECLDSVLAQTFGDWEAICVDDGSTDGSGSILDEYVAKDNRIKVIHQRNSGVSAARNVAMRAVKGEWVGFVDGDDVIARDWFLVASKAAVVNIAAKWIRMGFSFWQDSNSIPTAMNVQSVIFQKFGPTETIIEGWKSILPHGYPWRNFYKRDLLVGYEFNCNLRIQEDMYYSLNLLPSIGTSVWVDYDGYFYRYRRQSAWNGKMRLEDAENNLAELLAVWKPQSSFILRNPERRAVQKLIANISVKIIVEKFLRQFGFEQEDVLKRVIALIRQAAATRAFIPWAIPGSCQNKVRWFLFVRTGSSLAFRPLRYFYHLEWLRGKK